MFEKMEKINARPKPFEFYTADELWTDKHTSKMMLSYHLNADIDVSSRNAGFISRSVDWITAQFKISAETKIADFGCGPGLYTTKLAQKQAKVTGIDFSKRSIQYARQTAQQNGLSIRYENRNYLDYNILGVKLQCQRSSGIIRSEAKSRRFFLKLPLTSVVKVIMTDQSVL